MRQARSGRAARWRSLSKHRGSLEDTEHESNCILSYRSGRGGAGGGGALVAMGRAHSTNEYPRHRSRPPRLHVGRGAYEKQPTVIKGLDVACAFRRDLRRVSMRRLMSSRPKACRFKDRAVSDPAPCQPGPLRRDRNEALQFPLSRHCRPACSASSSTGRRAGRLSGRLTR